MANLGNRYQTPAFKASCSVDDQYRLLSLFGSYPAGTTDAGLAKRKGVVARRGLKEAWSKVAA